LSIPAAVIDPQIVKLENLNYAAWSVIAYQRTTVILTELVLGAVLVKWILSLDFVILILMVNVRFIRGAAEPSTQRIISASLFLHPGFLIVDHMHFQYNGFMFGILLWSILMARDVGFEYFWSHLMLNMDPRAKNWRAARCLRSCSTLNIFICT